MSVLNNTSFKDYVGDSRCPVTFPLDIPAAKATTVSTSLQTPFNVYVYVCGMIRLTCEDDPFIHEECG
jgi:hypothetical protein